MLVVLLMGLEEARATPRIVLEPILAGLQSPVFVTHARDGTHRLFVVEQAGRIKVLAPGAAEPTLFLDIAARVLAGGERGLLGLTFHPRYATTGRLFVNYTRQPDGATVIAEYRVSAEDANRAQPAERPLLVIAQPFANHNGGMIEFGPDGFLYIGTGDGGAAFDPDRRAQDVTDLLGKILRIDIDPPVDASAPYVSPPGNPFLGAHLGRDEILAVGLRNPWRFSFDRATGALYVGDVGQHAREEIDVVVAGGNYGWPILEGTACLDLGELPCTDPSLSAPVVEYEHVGGRCAVTGGYAYRGSRGTLASGAYVFGDFCSGEIWLLEEGGARPLLSTDLAISSFGEDESGEVCLVGLGGTVHRLVNLDAPTLALAVNQRRLGPGDTLRVTVSGRTGAEPVSADAYLGIILPDGRTVAFVTSLDPLTGMLTSVAADARTFPPLAAGLVIPSGTDATIDDWFVYTFGGAEPAGIYVIFVALLRPGSLADGRVDPGDVLAGAVETVTVSPMAVALLRGPISLGEGRV